MVTMASRTGSAAPGPRKPVTYGKPSRKRHMRDARPLRTAESHITSAETAEDSSKPPKPSLARSTSAPIAKQSTSERASTGDDQQRSAQTADVTNSNKKRKRPEATLPDTIHQDRVSPQKQPKPNPSLPRRPAANAAQTGNRPGLPQRESSTKKSHKNSSVRSRVLERSVSDVVTTKTFLETVFVPKPESTGPSKRRPRLIDALAAQKEESSESEDSAPEVDDYTPPSPSLYSRGATPSQSQSQGDSQTSQIRRTRPGAVLQGRRVKFTYGQSRSILSESSKLSEPAMTTTEEELEALFAAPPEPISADPFAMSEEEEDEDGDVRPAIKSVHELRRAGANNRFADEMEDLLARIGVPSSSSSTMRRNALLELTQKLQHKDFMIQFRDHASRDKVAANIGQEEDIISGFALVAVLITFLNFSPGAHLLDQLVQDGLGKLLRILLRVPEDIDGIAALRSTKLSKMSRKSINDVKGLLIRMSIWQGRRPKELSPQTLALQLLNILCQRIEPIHCQGAVRDVEADLVPILEHCVFADPTSDVRFGLAVLILESQSSLAMGDEDSSCWVSQQTPRVARYLQNSLEHWLEKPGDVETAILKLSINMSNTAHGAAAFNDRATLMRLVKLICAGVKSTSEAVNNKRLKGETYDGLLLMLGVTINIIEHCPPARENVGGEPLDELATLYFQNRGSMSEADSVETSQLTVVFGYLAVLLGYLSLVDSTRRRLAEQKGSEAVSDVIESVKEFIEMYRSVDSKVTELEGLVNELQRARRRT